VAVNIQTLQKSTSTVPLQSSLTRMAINGTVLSSRSATASAGSTVMPMTNINISGSFVFATASNFTGASSDEILGASLLNDVFQGGGLDYFVVNGGVNYFGNNMSDSFQIESLWPSNNQFNQLYVTTLRGSENWQPITFGENFEVTASTVYSTLPDSPSIARDTIDGFAERAPNWDGLGGVAPNQEAVLDARALLTVLPSKTPPDNLFSTGDGEIAFQWRRGSLFVEVGFFGDNTVSWFVRGALGEEHGDDGYDRANPQFPKALAMAFSALIESPVALLFVTRSGTTI
jgi:hypothetical protein